MFNKAINVFLLPGILVGLLNTVHSTFGMETALEANSSNKKDAISALYEKKEDGYYKIKNDGQISSHKVLTINIKEKKATFCDKKNALGNIEIEKIYNSSLIQNQGQFFIQNTAEYSSNLESTKLMLNHAGIAVPEVTEAQYNFLKQKKGIEYMYKYIFFDIERKSLHHFNKVLDNKTPSGSLYVFNRDKNQMMALNTDGSFSQNILTQTKNSYQINNDQAVPIKEQFKSYIIKNDENNTFYIKITDQYCEKDNQFVGCYALPIATDITEAQGKILKQILKNGPAHGNIIAIDGNNNFCIITRYAEENQKFYLIQNYLLKNKVTFGIGLSFIVLMIYISWPDLKELLKNIPFLPIK